MDKLLVRARQGDKSAEHQLTEFLLVRFNLLAKRRVGGEDARDIAQDACYTVLEKFKTEPVPENFERWAYSVLRKKIGNYYQRRNVRERIITDVSPIENLTAFSGAEDSDIKRRLIECLRRLARFFPRYARVLNFAYQGYDTGEICRRLEIKSGNLYVILNRGRKMLTDCLENGGRK